MDPNIRVATDEFIRRARKIHGDRYDYSFSIVEDSSSTVVIIDRETNTVFFQVVAEHLDAVEPVTTAVEPVTTTVEPVTTTVEPVTTAVEPVTTTVEPVTTAVEPVTTTVEPVTTTVEPVTTAVEPVTTAVEPIKNLSEIFGNVVNSVYHQCNYSSEMLEFSHVETIRGQSP